MCSLICFLRSGVTLAFIAALLFWRVSSDAGGIFLLVEKSVSLLVPSFKKMLIVILVGTFGAFGLYLHGVSVVGGVKGSLLGTMEPVSAMVFSSLWLRTNFVWADWVALFLMIGTVFLVSLQGGKGQRQG